MIVVTISTVDGAFRVLQEIEHNIEEKAVNITSFLEKQMDPNKKKLDNKSK